MNPDRRCRGSGLVVFPPSGLAHLTAGERANPAQARISETAFAAVVGQAKQTYGPVKITSLEVEVSGALARATYTYPVPALDQDAEPRVREGGAWKEDDC